MQNQFLAIMFFILMYTAACEKKNNATVTPPVVIPPVVTPPVPAAELIFNTGFEAGTSIVATSAQFAEFRGVDASVAKPNDWVNDFVNHPNIGFWRVYYEQGDSSQRLASIVPDPVNAANKVLSYKINVPHIDVPLSSQYTANGILFDKKARIQTDMYSNNGLKEIYQSIRLYVPTDFNKYINAVYPGNGDWLTLFEFWNNASWITTNYNFRFGINVEKGVSTVGSPLYFKAEGQKFATGYTQVWVNKNTSYTVPIAKWMTLEYYIREGNTTNGRFYFAVTPDGGTKTVVFDLTVATCHPDDPNPDGFTELNPIKLYTSNNMVNQMNARGGLLQVYWDDFKFWKNKRP